MRYYELFEDAIPSSVFAAAKRAQKTLSFYANQAIDKWETSNWIGGDLEEHFSTMDDIAQEIITAFEPVRLLLPAFSSLYRGVRPDNTYQKWEQKILESWSSDRRVAEHFAGLRAVKGYGRDVTFPSLLKPVMSADLINHYVGQYERTGFVKVGRRSYVRSKENPRYYQIFNGHENITDGDNLRRDLERDAEWATEVNQELLERGKVFEEEIPRNRVIWLTNSVNCKEFIVMKA